MSSSRMGRNRHPSMIKFAKLGRVADHGSAWARAVLGEFERLCGLPIHHIGTHRQAVEQWKQTLQIPEVTRGRFAISTLRNTTWIGAGVYMACVLRQMGYESTILYRGSEIARYFPSRHPWFGFWPGVGGIPGVQLVDLEQIPVTDVEMREFEECARLSAPAAVAYDLHIEEQNFEDADESAHAALKSLIKLQMRMGAAAHKHLSANRYERLLLYSGLIGESPALLHAAQKAGVHTVCLEGWGWRPGHMIYNHNAPALDYDIHAWMQKIQPWDEDKEQEVDRYLEFLDGKYRGGSSWLDSIHIVQRAKIAAILPPSLQAFVAEGTSKIFLAPTNVIGDSSMLRRETIFRGQQDWCAALIEHFRRRSDAKLIIRAHPGEIWFGPKRRIRMADVARNLAGDAKNVFVIDPSEQFNTFSLLPFVDAGLVWISSIGVDMVARGYPVLAAAKPKYAGLGIVQEPRTAEEYWALLESWILTTPRPNAAQGRMAKQYLYIVFKGFSYEAWGKDFLATSVYLNRPTNPADHAAFYDAITAGR